MTFEVTNAHLCYQPTHVYSTYKKPVDHKKIVPSWGSSGNHQIAGQLYHESHSTQKHQPYAYERGNSGPQ